MFSLHIPTNTESKGTVKFTQLSDICNLMNTNSSSLSRLRQSEQENNTSTRKFYKKFLGSYTHYYFWGIQILQKSRSQPEVLGA
jgi:hypothetical protein